MVMLFVWGIVLDRNKYFIKLSFIVIAGILAFTSILSVAAVFFSDRVFRAVFFLVSFFLFIIFVLILAGFLKVKSILGVSGRTGSAGNKNQKNLNIPTTIAFKVFIPFLLGISNFFHYKKDEIRHIYIKANNEYVLSQERKVSPEKILVILPHCLQNSKCRYRLVEGLSECHQCSSCNIGDIKERVSRYGINTQIATGGTSARKLIHDIQPEFVIAVACERDLSSGLMDVTNLPVYGILNKRPNGPCKDTFVDVNELCGIIEILKKE